MIGVLWAAIVVVAVMAAAALCVALLLARRYNEMYGKVMRGESGAVSMAGLPEPGSPVGEFTAVTTTGERLDRSAFDADDVIVAAFSAGCEPCESLAPRARATFAALPAGNPRPIVVLSGSADECAGHVAAFEPVARVIDGEHAQTALEALGIDSFPTIIRIGAGRTRWAGHSTAGIAAPVPV